MLQFHARNVFQVFGRRKIKSDFVVYYAPVDAKGNVLGGTRTAVGLADKVGMPTFNLKNSTQFVEFITFISCRISNEDYKKLVKSYNTVHGGKHE